MKKFLSIALLVVLAVSVLVVTSNASETPSYWSVSDNCYVKSKLLDDGTVPTYKEVETENGTVGLLIGIPTNAVLGDDYFEPKDGYSIEYVDKNGEEIYSTTSHIGTTDKIKVYYNSSVVAEYTLVTYGDADGDGIFDVIDASLAALCLKELIDATENAAVYEAVKPRDGVDNDYVAPEDYQQVVNDCIKDESEIEDNLKGRKTPVDQTLSFESVIYANTGATRAAVINATDDNFKNIITINYNGSATAPSDSGIYAITATVPESEKYLVTPGERNLGFMVIAPKAATGYKVTADNTNKKIVIGTTDNDTSNAPRAAEFEKWLNSAYALNIGGTVNPATVASALPNRSFEVYSGQTSTLVKTGNSEVLGSYLPDDETLWENNTASNSKAVNVSNGDINFDFTVIFQQDEATVENAKITYFADCAAASRGQRSDTNTTLHLYAKEINGMPAIRGAVKDGSAKIRSALGGTGLKGVLVGRADAISFQSSSSTDFSSSTVTSLFDSDGVKYSTLNLTLEDDYSNLSEVSSNVKKVIPVVNSVLSGLGCSSISTNLFSLLSQTIDDLGIVGKSGYCNYRCSGLSSSIRYNVTFYLEFKDYDTAEDGHYTLTVGSNVTVIEPATSTKYDAYTRMAGNEIIIATAPAGYKIVLKDASGNEISMNEEKGYYLMPYSNATIEAVAE